VVKYFVKYGIDINKGNYDRCTLLHLACNNRYENTMKELIEHGADINKKNDYGNTPLHFAYIHLIRIEILYLKYKI